MDRRTLGERIRAVRELRGMSQQDVSRGFGCARETVSNWERGERGIEAPELARLAQIFDVDITYFYGTGEYQADDVPPELQMVYGLQGKVVSYLPPGKARQRYIDSLRAQAESNWELIASRLEEESRQNGIREKDRKDKDRKDQEESERGGQNAGASRGAGNGAKAAAKTAGSGRSAGREDSKPAGKPQKNQEQ